MECSNSTTARSASLKLSGIGSRRANRKPNKHSNMQNIKVALLGFDIVRRDVPATLEEVITAAGGEQEVANRFIAHFTAHVDNGRVRSAIAEALEKATGVKRADKETEGAYVTRLEKELAERGESIQDLAETAQQAADSVPVDFSKKVRVGTGKPAAKWLAAVEQLFKLGKLDRAIEVFGIEAEDRTDEDEIESETGLADATIIAVAKEIQRRTKEAEEAARKAAMQELDL